MFKKLKDLLRLFNGRCIIVEDGEPRYVLIPFQEYVALRDDAAVQSLRSSAADDRREDRGTRDEPGEDKLFEAPLSAFEDLNEEMKTPDDTDMEREETFNMLTFEGQEEPSAGKEKSEYKIEDIPF